MSNILITFDSTNFAIQCESVIKSEKIQGTIMPTPREITKSCGISIKIKPDDLDKVIELIKNQKIRVKMLYKFDESRIFETIELNAH
ncbi:hypothetical protein ABG79_02265 [Caloramator mitchellensis]|uniref:Putative Se/S carrier protein-like domain-containing protein n=1 Tax=Caloramator mitchellensis TaxID=908809 RepID=A0A0R3JR97_CALMK|nr:DUF3343 domain-containing protein [Caloramator mitchellensis]KRQ85961.1 hypothetical protein ABG79_02265 [Caloramator mitchellensis]